MVVTLTVLLKSLKTLTISSNIPYEIGDTLTLDYQIPLIFSK
jgi:hypothetical protein